MQYKMLELADEVATIEAGKQRGRALLSVSHNNEQGFTVFLEGSLGAGKTTLTRGILQALGHTGAVKSPTYTLVEPYLSLALPVYHFDLYRLSEPEELAYIGIRDYFNDDTSEKHLLLIEWPDKGTGFLPPADVRLHLSVPRLTAEYGRPTTPIGRQLQWMAATPMGEHVLKYS